MKKVWSELEFGVIRVKQPDLKYFGALYLL